MVGVVSANAVH